MRKTVALAGIATGVALVAGPIAPASANCDVQIINTGSGECTNGCMETGRTYEAARERLKLSAVPSYWDLFVCPQ